MSGPAFFDLRRALGGVVAIGLLLAPGCAGFDFKGPGFDHEWGKNLRPANPGENAAGVSTKAREIEQNLGFQ